MTTERHLPRRRWFQFSLSTWFVLVAILAWAMMLRPYYQFELHTVRTNKASWDAACREGNNGFRGPGGVQVLRNRNGQYVYYQNVNRSAMNPKLLWPMLAFVTLICLSAGRRQFFRQHGDAGIRYPWSRFWRPSLFAAASILAVIWFAVQVHLIRSRNEIIHTPEVRCIQDEPWRGHLPILWAALGEEYFDVVVVPKSLKPRLEEIRKLFPEAIVTLDPNS